MDERFPRWLRTVLRKLDFLGIPNLGGLLCGVAVLAFVANNIAPVPVERFMFDPYLILRGEWWRLFSFIFTNGFQSPLSLLFYVLYIYFIVNALESVWGPGPVTVYVLFSVLACLGGAFVVMQRVDVSSYLLFNISLAFGTLFPEYELLLFFILPVKAKWLALIGVAFMALQFIRGDVVVLPISVIPYVVFFGPLLVSLVRNRIRRNKNRNRFDDDMWR